MALKNRRDFIQKTFWILAAFPLCGPFIAACTRSKTGAISAPPQGTQAVSEDDALAASLGYRADAATVDTHKFAKRLGSEGEKQFCHNCQFYSPINDAWGNCQIIRSGVVPAAGWCNTWAVKAVKSG